MKHSNKNLNTTARKALIKSSLLLSASLFTMTLAPAAMAQVADDEVIVTGIRQSLQNALIEKRESASLVEVILAEDIGKLPDQNLAEVLENITGIQITREEGVGTGVQIRGTGSNLTLINGVNTVDAGNGRQGISFEDINPAIIAGVEVIKAPEAKHIEGAVGGTINMRTIRPLSLKNPLASVRAQFEDSSLSSDGLKPRLSGALGNKWENASGQEIGVVVSGSFSESTNTAFRPRLDRDNLTTCTGDVVSTACPAGATHFLGVQFLNQVQRTQDYKTINIAGSVEARPTPNLRIYGDVIYNDQERSLSGSRAQASNVSRLNGSGDRAVTPGGNINFTAFDTFNLGSVPGPNGTQELGSILAVTAGTFSPLQEDAGTNGRGAPFLRVGSDAGSRLTETSTIRFGGEWERDAWTVGAEISNSHSESVNPNLSVNLNFINPNSYISPSGDGLRDENGTPLIFDLTDGFGWGINFADPFAPSEADLLNPDNYVVDGSPNYSADERENTDTAFRLDTSYDFAETGLSSYITSVDAGLRFSSRTTVRDDISASRSGSSRLENSLNAGGISQLLAEIPNNFGSATGNSLSVAGVLQVSPSLTRNTAQTVATINAAAATQGLGPLFTSELTSEANAFFDIEEDTTAIYGQVNFDFGKVRGNAGMRYVDTSIASTANVFTDGNATLTTVDSSYDHFLPRLNVAVDVMDDVILRGSYSKEINRPSFSNITAARTFPDFGGVNGNSVGGNPFLVPEEIDAFDASVDWYFAPEAVFSIGYFRKERDGLFGASVEAPSETGGLRDTTAPCEGGGIFSPGTEAGIFGNGEVGVCVGNQSTFNSDNTTTQQGIEAAFQYNLGQFEDRLGWASGFGMTANYAYQDETNNSGFVPVTGNRNLAIFAAQGLTDVQREAATLLNLSKHAYNLTGYYEKYGLSARMRYTWRDAFATSDLPGTGNVFTPIGFRGVVEPRGQLNGSLSYDVTDQLTVNVDAVNLTESNADVSCTSDGGLPCYQVVTDRRVIFGASYTF